jgi:hypothetical protein
MTKYLITAVLQVEYAIEVEAESEDKALATLNDWIDDDFKPHQTNAVWDFEIQENE